MERENLSGDILGTFEFILGDNLDKTSNCNTLKHLHVIKMKNLCSMKDTV